MNLDDDTSNWSWVGVLVELLFALFMVGSFGFIGWLIFNPPAPKEVTYKALTCSCTYCICQCDNTKCCKVADNTPEGRASLGLPAEKESTWNEEQLNKHKEAYAGIRLKKKEIRFIGDRLKLTWYENDLGMVFGLMLHTGETKTCNSTILQIFRLGIR